MPCLQISSAAYMVWERVSAVWVVAKTYHNDFELPNTNFGQNQEEWQNGEGGGESLIPPGLVAVRISRLSATYTSLNEKTSAHRIYSALRVGLALAEPATYCDVASGSATVDSLIGCDSVGILGSDCSTSLSRFSISSSSHLSTDLRRIR
jgi:hypothetical protein